MVTVNDLLPDYDLEYTTHVTVHVSSKCNTDM